MNLVSEIEFQILLKLENCDYINLAKCNRYFSHFLQDDYFWKQKVKLLYHYTSLPSCLTTPFRPWYYFYINLTTQRLIHIPLTLFSSQIEYYLDKIWILSTDSLQDITTKSLQLIPSNNVSELNFIINKSQITDITTNYVDSNFVESKNLIFIQTTDLTLSPTFNVCFAKNKRIINTELSGSTRINLVFLKKLQFVTDRVLPSLTVLSFYHFNKLLRPQVKNLY